MVTGAGVPGIVTVPVRTTGMSMPLRFKVPSKVAGVGSEVFTLGFYRQATAGLAGDVGNFRLGGAGAGDGAYPGGTGGAG
jgi:hypothetical protein